MASLDRGEILVASRFAERHLTADMQGVVEAPPETVWPVVINIEDWRYFHIPTLQESRFVDPALVAELAGLDPARTPRARKMVRATTRPMRTPRLAGGEWPAYAFQFYNFPWPVADRWAVLDIAHDERRRQTHHFEARWRKIAGNLQSVTGYFDLSPFKGDPTRTLVIYHVEADPGISVPSFLLNYGTKRILPKIILALRERVAHDRAVDKP